MKNRPLITAALLACALAGCNRSTSSSTTTIGSPGPAASGTKVIGFSVQDNEAQFYQDLVAGMQAEAAKYGYTIHVVDANRDNSKQQSQVEDFISQKVDAIVLTPYDSQAIGSAIVEANKANIPVFTADIANSSKNGKVISHVASDNVQGGAEAGKLMCAAVGKVGTVAIIDQPEVTSVQDRVRGFRQAIKADCKGVTIVADVSGGGARDKASAVMDDILQTNHELRGVFGINDDSALGAAKSVEAAKLGHPVAIVGYDASKEARDAIKAGTMYGDAIQHPDQIGAKTIQAIHDYFSGKKPPAKISVTVGTFTKANVK